MRPLADFKRLSGLPDQAITEQDAETIYHNIATPDDLLIVTAGGKAGGFSAVVPPWAAGADSRPVTRAVGLCIDCYKRDELDTSAYGHRRHHRSLHSLTELYHNNAEKFIVLDPTLEVETQRVERAARPAHIRVLGLLDNGKRNSHKLLQEWRAMLKADHPGVTLNYYRKPSAYRPAPSDLLDQVVSRMRRRPRRYW